MDTVRHGGTGRLASAGIVLGLSLGGFADGIIFHQVLQWHHMLTSVADPEISDDLALNITADGLFHVATWIMAVIGLVLLWHARRAFGVLHWARTFVGSILMGAGIFNLVEGIVDHHLLGLHHVRTDAENVLLWDLGFLALGLALLVAGWAMRRSAVGREAPAAKPSPAAYAAAGSKPERRP